jgi:hypothetical protein
MCLADNAHDDRTLLDGLLCVLNLEYTSLRRERHRVVVIVVSEHGGCLAVLLSGDWRGKFE